MVLNVLFLVLLVVLLLISLARKAYAVEVDDEQREEALPVRLNLRGDALAPQLLAALMSLRTKVGTLLEERAVVHAHGGVVAVLEERFEAELMSRAVRPAVRGDPRLQVCRLLRIKHMIEG